MELTGKRIVVPARRGDRHSDGEVGAEHGAEGAVVVDLDAERDPQAAADDRRAGGAVAGDVADAALLKRAFDAAGPRRPVLRQRGVGTGGGLGGQDDWDAAFGVNIRSHIYAAKRSSRLGRARRGPIPDDRVRGRAAHADRRRAVRRDQARGRRVRRVAVGHLRRPRHPRELPGADGRQHEHAQRRPGRRRARVNVVPRRARSSSPSRSPTRSWPRSRRTASWSCRTPRCRVPPAQGADYDRWLAGMRRLQAAVPGV